MNFVLFHILTGTRINSYETEDGARIGMRASNRNAGWERIGRSWSDGYEQEWCVNSNGEEGYGPYGITEEERWEKKFHPTIVSQRRLYDERHSLED